MPAAWYAAHVRSNQERVTAELLEARGVEHFLPTYRVASKRADRRVVLSRPLFTGYVFVRLDLASGQRIAVLRAPGVVRLVGFGDAPTAVPDETIRSLRILVEEGDGAARPHPLVREGQRVTVVDGSFRGAVGVLHVTADRKPRLVVEVEFLGRGVSVPITAEQVQPLL
ncbi:MAG: UpxY family transcription antiterminator [Proteobacteria bacterium]|nr:UpxY family transcription antiterminator [Pseudomonadota bacterium]